MSDRRQPRVHRRTFLKAAGTAAGAAALGFPAVLRAQAPTLKVGAVHPITGPLAEPGQACRLGAQMAADAINAAGGIKSLNGMKVELLLGDTQTKPDIGRTEAERVINQGAQVLMGSFDSGSTAAMVPVVQQRRIPFLVDIAAADPITANVARAVKDGQQKTQYVYRNFPTGTSFGRRAVQYFGEVFKEANVSPKRVVLMYCNDLFGQNNAKGFQAAHAAAKPDIIAPITRPASAQLLLPEIRKQRLDILGIVGPGSPGLYEAGQLAALKEDLEYVMSSLPWANFKNPRTQAVAAEYLKRSNGKTFDTNSGYSYDGMMLIADVLERAKSTDPDAIVEALRKSNWSGGLMQYAGPVVFNELGDNPNAVTTMIQILGGKPVAVWPKEAAVQKFVFPRPKA